MTKMKMKLKPSTPLDAIVYGTRKFQKLREWRADATWHHETNDPRRPFVSDLDELPARETLAETDDENEGEALGMARKRAVFDGFLGEFTATNNTYRILIQRRLIGGEPLKALAKELGIHPTTARSQIHRFCSYVGIAGRGTPR